LAADKIDHATFQAFLKRSRDPENAAGVFQQATARRKNGTTFPVEVVTSPVELEDGERYLAIIRDVTERRRVEQMKNEFVSTVSHELRTPLTSIAGSLGLLAGGAAGALPERAAKLIRIAHGNSERLVRLINDILDIEKIESGKMTFDIRPTPLRPLLEQAIASNHAYAQEFGVTTHLDDSGAEGATVQADPDRLMQVVINLLSNAAKFSQPGGRVEVKVRRDGAFYCINVHDHGSGIPDEFKDRIFSKFAQADSSDTRAKGGTGLGLSIVKEIVARHNGTVTFTSNPDDGTEFVVGIPAADAPASRRADATLILLCEGDAAGAKRVRESLERAGFVCDIATSTSQLDDLTSAKDYSVLILDLPLPGADMIDLICRLRSTERHALTPILVVSTETERDEVSQVLDVADWINKPLAMDRLVEGVRSAIAGVDGRPRILHVEDDLDVLGVVATAFDGRAQVSAATDLAEAREALARDNFDLVILDIALPSGSGVELLPEMRNALGQPIPVVIFSAYETAPDLARRVEATLTKSRASLDNLVDTVELLVQRSARSKRVEKSI
jgi:signal transduction histidine kinase/DNA-binding response OmpR family regulator